MKRPLLNIAICLMIISGMLSSCVKEVTLDAGDRTVVVECLLSNEPVQELSLSFSKGASEASAMELTEAVATLIDLTAGETVGEFKRNADGKWRMDYAAIPLHKYRLEVKVPGYDLIYAEDKMPGEVDIDMSGSWFDFEPRPTASSFSKDLRYMTPEDFRMRSTGCYYSHMVFDQEREIVTPLAGKHLWVYGMRLDPSTGKYELADRICTNIDRYAASIDDFNVTGEVFEPLTVRTPYNHSYDGRMYPTYFSYGSVLEGYPIHDTFLRIEVNLEHFLGSGHIWCDFLDMKKIEDDMTAMADSSYVPSDRSTRLMGMHGWLNEVDCRLLEHYDYTAPALSNDGFLVFKLVSNTYNKYFEDALFQIRRKGQTSTDLSELSIYMRENISSNVKGGAGIFAASTQLTLLLNTGVDILYDFDNPI